LEKGSEPFRNVQDFGLLRAEWRLPRKGLTSFQTASIESFAIASILKECLKTSANAAATILVLPAFLLYQLGRLILGAQRVFPGWSQAMSLVPGMTGAYMRRAFYRLILPRCGKDCWISFGTVFSHPTAEVGQLAYIGLFCSLGDVTLEADVLVGSQVSIMNGAAQHGIDRLDIPVREQPGKWQRLIIGRDTWIGDRAVIMADVGKHCVVGAGAVVTRALPDYAIAVGVPAKIVGYRNSPPAEPS
jgi:acetyltransferase-like isoleucine patch superfamily enzyme